MTKGTILYVEDDLEVRENYSMILEGYFGNVSSTGCGKEALELYKNNNFDLLILDINLPHLSGLEIAAYVRKKDLNTKIIMLTAYSDRDRLLEAVNLKLDSYLIKPVDNKTFVETVRKYFISGKKSVEKDNNINISENLIWNMETSILSINNETIKLTKKETILISALVKSLGSYIDKDSIIQKVWEDEFTDHSHNQKLTQLVYRLNKKLMKSTNSQDMLIQNNYSIGYKIEIN